MNLIVLSQPQNECMKNKYIWWNIIQDLTDFTNYNSIARNVNIVIFRQQYCVCSSVLYKDIFNYTKHVQLIPQNFLDYTNFALKVGK